MGQNIEKLCFIILEKKLKQTREKKAKVYEKRGAREHPIERD